jgi:tetratricopeptide (TPR) repeat protein
MLSSITRTVTPMSTHVSLLWARFFLVATALGFASTAVAQPVPPPIVGDISVDPGDARPLEEVRKLIAAGRTKQALAFADEQLVKNPRNAQMRFVRGVILSDMNDTAAARRVFEQLTEDFPELPEPYNNLAVLYAADGQLDRARGALEMALLARPDYATAHENMGDVYLQMAADAYQRAATLQPANRSLSTKLALTREMITKARNPR